MAATSSSDDVTLKYDVFLSFSGEDTRKGFTNTLFDFLKSEGIETFIDDGLPRGQQIESSLMKMIAKSLIAVVVFSEKYASSSWCLDELLKIRESNLVIMPIFYKVKPDDVWKQSGKFGEEFAKLKSTENEVKIKKWSNDLAFAAVQSGWDLANYRTEMEVIKEVAVCIHKYLESINVSTYSGEFSHYIGITPLVDDLKSSLANDSSKVQFLGLWGMAGIGKTTIAEVLYHQLSPNFDRSYFCSIALGVKDVNTLVALRNQIISHILKEPFHEGSPGQPRAQVMSKLRRKKVLIIVDNVSSSNQLTTLVGSKANPWFATGSKIIVTGRDFRVLEIEDVTVWQIKEMSKQDSLRLFCLHAFKENHPPDNYRKWSEVMVGYTKGLPLALKVLGRHLYRGTKDEWISTIETLEARMDSEIQDVLMISYNVLSTQEKEIFLDIACFFNGYDKDRVKEILEGCGNRIAHLIEKCLITLDKENRLGMHDLVQQMGRDIVEEQSRSNFGLRKRIWKSSDSCNLLTSFRDAKTFEETTKAIEGIFLDTKDDNIKDLIIHPMVFSKMQNLRLLKFHQNLKLIRYLQYLRKFGRRGDRRWGIYIEPPLHGLCLFLNSLGFKDWYREMIYNHDRGIQFLPNTLRFLYWEGYSGAYLPSSFSAENIVELHLWNSKLKQLWKGAKNLQNSVNLKNLTVLNLKGSTHLTTLPDLTSTVKLREITLDYCESLLEIPSSIQQLQSLFILSARKCQRLCRIPCLLNMETLSILDLQGCKCLMELTKTNWSNYKNLRPSPTELLQQMHDLNVSPYDPLKIESSSYVTDGGIQEPHGVIHAFNFVNCDNLSEDACRDIVEKAMVRIHRMANRKGEVLRCPLTVNLPGSEIPEFFKSCKEGSSITVELPADLSSSMFRGFVIGLILTCAYPDIKFQCELKNAAGSLLHSYLGSIFIGHLVSSSTLCLHYSPDREIRQYCRENLKDAITATFSFWVRYSRENVVKCGVHLMYAERGEVTIQS